MSWEQRVVSMILDIMKYVCKCPVKDTAKVSRKGKFSSAKRQFPDEIHNFDHLSYAYVRMEFECIYI